MLHHRMPMSQYIPSMAMSKPKHNYHPMPKVIYKPIPVTKIVYKPRPSVAPTKAPTTTTTTTTTQAPSSYAPPSPSPVAAYPALPMYPP